MPRRGPRRITVIGVGTPPPLTPRTLRPRRTVEPVHPRRTSDAQRDLFDEHVP
jgi:hypothetical protein